MKNINNNLAFIVEDNEMFSKMLNHTLSNSSEYRFKSFKSGEECINNMYMNPLMIIMDYGLPGMDGLETFKTIKEYNPDIPIVVLTSMKDEKIAKDFINEGAYAFFVKQKISVHQIIKVINTIADNSGGNRDKEHNKNTGALIALFLIVVAAIVSFYFISR